MKTSNNRFKDKTYLQVIRDASSSNNVLQFKERADELIEEFRRIDQQREVEQQRRIQEQREAKRRIQNKEKQKDKEKQKEDKEII